MIVDLYAGSGGWDCAAHQLGLDPIGIELDDDTCATRAAAGLRTIRAQLGPDGYHLPPATRLDGLIASPPCQAFSAAGGREAAGQLQGFLAILEHADWAALPQGWHPDLYLLAEVGRWALDHQPRWIACEQVPAVLPFWQALGRRLALDGWSWWAGILNAADYGVPQCRRRAIFIARSDRAVQMPEPTHAESPQADLFGGCPERWVSMAEALGIDQGFTVNLRQNSRHGGGRLVPYRRSAARPAATVTGQSAGGQWVLDRREHTGWTKPTTLDRPAPTVTGSSAEHNWVLRSGQKRAARSLAESAPTVAFGNDLASWCFERPATTIAGDRRVQPPGRKINQADRDAGRTHYEGRAGRRAVRLEVPQLATLQGFPAGFTFAGNTSAQLTQVGNAVPPALAAAVVRSLVNA